MESRISVVFEQDGPIARIRLNRPEVRNALDFDDTKRAFLAACRTIAADASVRAVVVSGEGRAFVAGGDLAEMRAAPTAAAGEIIDHMTESSAVDMQVNQSDSSKEIHVMASQCKLFLSPIKVGQTMVKNRSVLSSHETHYKFTEDDNDGEWYADYIDARAKGGCAFIVAGAIMIHRSSSYKGLSAPEPEILMLKMRRLADRVHKHDTKILAQLLHTGREMNMDDALLPQWAFSAIPSPIFEETPHEMTVAEIKEVIDSYVKYSVVTKEAGYDGIELHGTHGYLIQQSWSPWANQRTDEYRCGMNFVTELLNKIRDAVGKDFIVGIRISVDDLMPGGMDNAKMVEVAEYLESTAQVDFIDTSAGGLTSHYGFTIGPNYVPLGAFVPMIAKIKAALKTTPVIAAIRINDPMQAEAILENGYADMVVMTRAHIADPDIVNKAAEGKFDDIRHCIGCIQGCIKRIFEGRELTCTQNPITGRERKYEHIPSISRKAKLVVVGGGVAGMEAARLGAERGFDVTLFEKDQELGGQVRLMCKSIPEREEFNETVRWRKKQLETLGVDVRTGTAVDAATIKGLGADKVVIATGALPRNIGVPGSDAPNVFTDLEWVTEGREIGDNVLIVDKTGRPQGLVIADHLTKQEKKVTIVTQQWFPGQNAGFLNIVFLYQGLLQHGTKFIPNSALAAVNDGEVTIVNVYSFQTTELGRFDTILTITPPIANDGIYRELLAAGVDCIAIGDSLAPRDAQTAIRDGFDAVAAMQV